MSKSATNLANLLQSMLNEPGATKSALRMALGLSASNLDRILAGNGISFETLDRMADAMNVEPWELIKSGSTARPYQPHTIDDCLGAVARAVHAGSALMPLGDRLARLSPEQLADVEAVIEAFEDDLDSPTPQKPRNQPKK